MTANNQNFQMYAGDSKNIVVTCRQEDGKDLNLTGATIKWVLKKTVLAGTNDLSKATGSGITITDAVKGKFEIKLNATDTTSLLNSYYHKAEVTDSSGNVSTVLVGNAKFDKS